MDVLRETFMEDAPVVADSPVSPDSAASIARLYYVFFIKSKTLKEVLLIFLNFFEFQLILKILSSGIDSARRHLGFQGDERNAIYEEEDVIQNRFERLLQEKLDLPGSDNGIYLARTVAPVLTKALAEVNLILKQIIFFKIFLGAFTKTS